MVTVILGFLYIAFITTVIGFGVRKSLARILLQNKCPLHSHDITPRSIPSNDNSVANLSANTNTTTAAHTLTNNSLIQCIITGVVALTVYAEYISIFMNVGLICHLIMLAVTALICVLYRKDLFTADDSLFRTILKSLDLRSSLVRLVIYSAIIIIIAFYTSRGAFHTDTNIYHAQMIRIYEDYGLIKGMGNLQLHYAYNSAYLAFCSLFSMHFILPQPLHMTTGFLEAALALFAAGRLLDWHKHSKHVADISMLGIIIYIIVNITGSMSPATDYGTMFLSLYLICAWLINAERSAMSEVSDNNISDESEPVHEASNMSNSPDITGVPEASADQLSAVKTYEYALLSVLALFTVSCKLSAAVMVLLMIIPLIAYIRRKNWLTIIKCLVLGLLVFLPFLIRNVLISGWLFYPFEIIDLFNVAWKIPVEYLRVDSAQIKVWGRCLYDVSLIDMPVTQWFTIWWHEQRTYTRVLFVADAFGTLLLVADLFIAKMKQKRHLIDLSTLCLIITLYLSALMWLFTAPFVRYGLAFLLMIPLIAIGINYDLAIPMHIPGKTAIVNRYGAIIVIAICFAPYLYHYFKDDAKFISQYAVEPYYVVQKDYDDAETGSVSLNGNTVYYSEAGEVNSYYYCPNTCYKFMLDRSELIGDTIGDGFKAKQ